MRAFTGGYYKQLRRLYDHLGLRYRPQQFVFAFSKLSSDSKDSTEKPAKPYFTHASNNHRIPPLKPQGLSIIAYFVETIYLALVYFYFALCCALIEPRRAALASASPGSTSPDLTSTSCETLDEYLSRIRIPKYFTRYYILPLLSSVATCSHAALLQFPACDIIGYKWKSQREQHFVLVDGVGEAQKKLAHGIEDVRLSAHVMMVEPQSSGGVKIQWRHTEDTHCLAPLTEKFDSVILAVSPNVVGKIFSSLRKPMAHIPSIYVESVVHSDDSAIQSQMTSLKGNGSRSQSILLQTCTIGQITESIHVQPSGVIVTTCPFSPIDQERVIQSAAFTRVLRTPKSRAVVNEIFEPAEVCGSEKLNRSWHNGDGNVWLAGGWCWDGMVLLEGCVVSAFRIAEAFGVPLN